MATLKSHDKSALSSKQQGTFYHFNEFHAHLIARFLGSNITPPQEVTINHKLVYVEQVAIFIDLKRPFKDKSSAVSDSTGAGRR